MTRTDLGSGQVEVLAPQYEGKPLGAPNDVTVDGRDGSTSPTRARPEPYTASTLAAGFPGSWPPPGIEKPNGIMISPDDRTLYLVESNQAERGARMIRAYDLAPDGTRSQHAGVP